MLGILQRGRMALLVLAAMVAPWGSPVAGHRDDCRNVQRTPCVNRTALENLAVTAAQNISSADDWTILLQIKQFKKITRLPKLHGCVILRVANFYDHVFREKLGITKDGHVEDHRGPLVDLMGLMQMLDDCVRVDESKCEGLNAKAEKTPLIEIPPKKKKMEPRELAILQIQQINQAIKNISDEKTLSKAMDELKRLPDYIKGSGVRKWSKL